VKLIHALEQSSVHLGRCRIMDECGHSRSQLYQWMDSVRDRKDREAKPVDPDTVQNAAQVILQYPHMGGRKGQAYMIYHRLGLIGQKAYDKVKTVVGRLVSQEVHRRKLLPARTSFTHEPPERVGQVWAEDFTRVKVCGVLFFVALVMDVKSTLYLGAHAEPFTGQALVTEPVCQALETNDGQGPEWFALRDNGKEYVAKTHEELLRVHEIVHKLIPAAKPEFNGAMECGVKEFKNVFYAIWARNEKKADKEKSLLDRVRATVEETRTIMNTELPRPCLKGVTARDVHLGCQAEKREANARYVEAQKERTDFPAWKKGFWKTIKEASGLGSLDDRELFTTFCFFGRRPLRQITKYAGVAVG